MFYSIALDESTDMSHTAQLAVFIWGVSEDFEITEVELLGLQPMKGTTQGTDLFTSLIELLNKFKLKLTNLAGVATDGCPSMAVKNKGIVALVKKVKATKMWCIITVSFINSICVLEELGLEMW